MNEMGRWVDEWSWLYTSWNSEEDIKLVKQEKDINKTNATQPQIDHVTNKLNGHCKECDVFQLFLNKYLESAQQEREIGNSCWWLALQKPSSTTYMDDILKSLVIACWGRTAWIKEKMAL